MRGAKEGFLSLEEILEATRGRLLAGDPGVRVRGISTDTRSLLPGQMFLALEGERFDGHDFVASALAKGACGAVVRRGKLGSLPPQRNGSRAALVEVEDTLFALGEMARRWRELHSTVVVGITGSNGKTTTKEMLASILERSRSVLKNEGNLNNRIGLPLTLLGLKEHHRAVVLEMGMNEPGEIGRLCQIARPQVGLITQVAPAHLEGLGSLQGVAREKGELFLSLGAQGKALVNLDDPWVVSLARSCEAHKLSYGTEQGAMVRGLHAEPFHVQGARLCLEVAGDRRWVQLRGQGTPLVRGALAAAAGAWALGASLDEIKEALESFRPSVGRLHVTSFPQGGTLIDDTYNANPASMAAALELLCKGGEGRTVAVLGEMRELGPLTLSAHREVGQTAARLGVKLLVAVGPWAPWVAEGAGKSSTEVHAVGNCQEAIELLKGLLRPGDRILVKGSRAAAMETVAEAIRASRLEVS
jgi:UDP-N-acetylmuramoyl-tripeptide--D-alanyl-D-alanine ligase